MLAWYCVVPENIHTSLTEGIFSNTSPPLWKFQESFIHFFIFFDFPDPPIPRKFQSLLWGEYGYFLELHIVNSFTRIDKYQMSTIYTIFFFISLQFVFLFLKIKLMYFPLHLLHYLHVFSYLLNYSSSCALVYMYNLENAQSIIIIEGMQVI